jgi:hypothetical protein
MSNIRISLVFRDSSDILHVKWYKDLIHGTLIGVRLKYNPVLSSISFRNVPDNWSIFLKFYTTCRRSVVINFINDT